MAYARERFAEFRDDFGQDWLIEILKEGFSGTPTEFKVDQTGFVLTWAGAGDGIFSPMKASECNFVFFSENATDDTFIRAMIDASPGVYACRIYKDTAGTNTMWWCGMIMLDGVEFVDDYYPQPHKLRAIDGLNYLKTKDISELTNILNINGNVTENFFNPPTGGNSYNGNIYNLLPIIVRSLFAIPTEEFFGASDRFVKSQFNFSETNFSAGNDPFYNIAAQSNAFYKQNNDGTFSYKTIYDTLEQILKTMNARLFFENGFWHLEQISCCEQYGTTNQKFKFYNKTWGVESTGTSSQITAEITSAGSIFRKQDFISTFQQPINKIDTEVIKLPPYSPVSWSTQTEQTISADPTPVAGDYTNTFTAAPTASALYTFTLHTNFVLTANNPTYPSSNFSYFIWLNYFVKCGTQYMYWDALQSKFRWDTTVQSVFQDFAQANYAWVDSYGANNVVIPFVLGWDDTNHMEQMPNTNEVEYYYYYRVMGYLWNTMTWSDQTASFASGDHSVKTQSEQIGGFGSGYASTHLNLYKNGVQVDEFLYTVTNNSTGAILEGGEFITDEVMFANEPDPISASNIFVWDGVNTFAAGGWVQGRNEFVNDNVGAFVPVALPICRAVDRIGLRHKNTEIITGNILKTESATTLDVYTLNEVLLYNSKKYICNGCTFTANSGTTNGEFQELVYNNVTLTTTELAELFSEAMFENWHGTNVGWNFNF